MKISVEKFKANRESLKPTDYAEACADVWSIQGDFICRHHNESRVQLYVLQEETFPIPLKYIDFTRSTLIDLDVLQEKTIDDYWNVDSKQAFVRFWRGFAKFTLLEEKPSQDSNDYGRKLVKPLKIEKNKNGQKKEPKLDNARKLKWNSLH